MMNTNTIVISVAFIVIVAAFVGLALWLDMRKKEVPVFPVQRASVIQRPVPDIDSECRNEEEVHAKYAKMAETDPIAAGRLKYAELIRLHGK